MKEENFASATSIERVWFVDSDEAVYSKAPYTHCLTQLRTSWLVVEQFYSFFLRILWRTRKEVLQYTPQYACLIIIYGWISEQARWSEYEEYSGYWYLY